MVDLGMVFVDNWVVGKEKVCYWLSDDVVVLVERKYGSEMFTIGFEKQSTTVAILAASVL